MNKKIKLNFTTSEIGYRLIPERFLKSWDGSKYFILIENMFKQHVVIGCEMTMCRGKKKKKSLILMILFAIGTTYIQANVRKLV